MSAIAAHPAAHPVQAFEAVVAACRDEPGVIQAKMFGSPGLRVNGKVFACLVKGQLVVKLPQARVATLLAEGKAQRFDPGMGRLMKEWAAVDPGHNWIALAEEARAFVAASAA